MFEIVRDDGYILSSDPARLDVDYVHRYISEEAYWARGRERSVMETAIAHSLCFGLYRENAQVGFARVVTDFAVFGDICDLFVDPSHRGKALGKWLLQGILNSPEIAPVRRLLLVTRDAHGLYIEYGGFAPVDPPQNWLMRLNR